MKDTEIEIQVRVDSVKDLTVFLKKEGKFIVEVNQIDEYFTPAHRDFTAVRPVEEWFRIRKTSNGNFVTYKKWYTDKNSRSHHCDEYETGINDEKKFRKILEAMDFKSLAVVNKVRKTWMYKDYEIALDSIKNLGNFIEIEYKGKENNVKPEKVTEEMVRFLKERNCGTIYRNYQGYPFQLIFPNEINEEIIK